MACEPVALQQRNADLEKALRDEQATTKRLSLELAAEKAEVAVLRDELRSNVQKSEPSALTEPLAGKSSSPVEMCFKDYCPCDPPQGGPDTVICDQLEQGIPVDIQLMIGGRGMREARRQMAEGDY
ncbi:hypothetical protein [Sphingomonas sp.]|uniref:hypothetical protein n=1 Tax=Sphingomonas sp. TaxID=28214 RepID=UPI002608213C|nr:hypothetical protein [Sphingomonas sp.]